MGGGEKDVYLCFTRLPLIWSVGITIRSRKTHAEEEDSAELETIAETNGKVDDLQKQVVDLSSKMDLVLAALEKRYHHMQFIM
jgi:cell division protein FtsL